MSEIFPITKQQEGLWIEWRLHPDNTSYNTCVKLRLEGKLDNTRFERALGDVAQFFSSLRVSFIEQNGLPFQKIEDSASYTLDFLDISVDGRKEETTEQAKQAKEFLENKLRTPVDLKTFPIVRAGLVKTTEETFYFIGLVPHIISDGASAILFLESTSIAYNEGYAGLEKAYGKDKKDWSDYFEEFEGAHTGKTSPEAARYWHENMQGAEHSVDFSHGQKSQHNDIKTGKRIYFDLDADLSKKLKDYSRKQKTTLFSTLVASFSTLIHRYYNQDDLLIGYPVNIRPPGYKYLFGFFVNIIPIRVDLSGDPDFDDLVSRISSARKKDKKYQTFPALDIVREIRKSVPGFDGRVFNVSMAQTVSRLVNLNLEGITSIPLEAEYNDVNDDLSLSYELLEDGRIGLWIEYRVDLFKPEFIDAMLVHLYAIMKQAVAAPQTRLSAFEITNAQEKEKILTLWSRPDAQIKISKDAPNTIHSLIEQQCKKTPDTIALTHKGEHISYAELDARANKLAHHIKYRQEQAGLGAGDNTAPKIALLLERGPDMIIALLAVMKAGCAYVPIPPNYPKDRLDFIVKDAHCNLAITHNGLDDKLKSVQTICLNKDASLIAAYPTTPSAKTVHADDHAYIIYTSGSTGNPKGVLLDHANVVPRLHWLQSEMPLSAKDVILQNTDYSFDVSVAEIFWPLTTGAQLILTEQEKYKDPSYLIDLINQHKVTTTCFVPSLLNSLLAVLGNDTLKSLKYVLAAGEALPPTLVKTYYKKCTGTLYNIYGPTEAAIYAAFKKCAPDTINQTIPIGRPLGQTHLYILDNRKQPVPVGVAGELYIGGAGVALGYVNLPEMTAEKFIKIPFTNDNINERLYRTGDLVKFNADGDIEYLGRIDNQVKIRGFRIELAEIEAVISAFDGIKDAAVVDHTTENNKRIVAYYVGNADIDILKQHVKSKLPDYMQPAFFIPIDTVPRMPSGKINRRALPRPENLIVNQAKYVAPTSKIEKDLVAIWASILKIPAKKIGIHDSFFEIGGDSLMAIQFACEAEEKGIAFKTNALFNSATIAELAAIATQKTSADIDREEEEHIEGAYPLLPRQAKFFADNFKNPNHWNRFFAFETDHDVDMNALETAFDRVLAHHDNLRIAITKDNNGNLQQDCKKHIPVNNYIFTHDLSNLTSAEQAQKYCELVNKQHSAIDLNTAPLIRVLYFKTDNNQGKLAVIIHHLLVDMVSSRIIFEDFLKSYESIRHKIDIPLPHKTTSAKNWANYIKNLAQNYDFKEEKSYWASEKMHPTPHIDTDYPENKIALDKNATQSKIILDEETTRNILKSIPRATGFTIQDILLSCLNKTMHDWTGENSLLVNICGHGRNTPPGYNLTRTAAWVNTVFPVYLEKIQTNESAYNQVKNTKSQIKAVPEKNEYYNILRYTKRDPDILKYPTPEVFFNYVSQVDAIIPDGISFKPVPEPGGLIGSDPENHLCYLLYIEAGVIEKKINIHITYGQDIFKNETIEKFAQNYENSIRAICLELKQDTHLHDAAE